jgi:NADH-quinone oxidoreductase E subunit
MEIGACKCGKLENSDERFQQLDEVIQLYKGKKGALIPVLHRAQEIFGYLPEAVQDRIANGLGIPISEVYGVTTFYSHFTMEPRGRHRIAVCLGTACYVKGAAAIVDEIQKELGIRVGSTTQDECFTLEVTRCLGACGLAPVMMIGDDVYGKVTPDKVKEILKKYE